MDKKYFKQKMVRFFKIPVCLSDCLWLLLATTDLGLRYNLYFYKSLVVFMYVCLSKIDSQTTGLIGMNECPLIFNFFLEWSSNCFPKSKRGQY